MSASCAINLSLGVCLSSFWFSWLQHRPPWTCPYKPLQTNHGLSILSGHMSHLLSVFPHRACFGLHALLEFGWLRHTPDLYGSRFESRTSLGMSTDEICQAPILAQFEENGSLLWPLGALLPLLATLLVVCNGMCQICLLVVSSHLLLPVPHYNNNTIHRPLLHCCGDEKPLLSQDVLLGNPKFQRVDAGASMDQHLKLLPYTGTRTWCVHLTWDLFVQIPLSSFDISVILHPLSRGFGAYSSKTITYTFPVTCFKGINFLSTFVLLFCKLMSAKADLALYTLLKSDVTMASQMELCFLNTWKLTIPENPHYKIMHVIHQSKENKNSHLIMTIINFDVVQIRNLRPKTRKTLLYFHYSALRVNTCSLWLGIRTYAKRGKILQKISYLRKFK